MLDLQMLLVFFFKEESSEILVPFSISWAHFQFSLYSLIIFFCLLCVFLCVSLKICRMLLLQLIKTSEVMTYSCSFPSMLSYPGFLNLCEKKAAHPCVGQTSVNASFLCMQIFYWINWRFCIWKTTWCWEQRAPSN